MKKISKIVFLFQNSLLIKFIFLWMIEFLITNIINKKSLLNSTLKAQRISNNFNSVKKVFLSKHYYSESLANLCSNYSFEFLDLKKNIKDLSSIINSSIIIINSNEILNEIGIYKFYELKKMCNKSTFISYMYDNHHLLSLSALIANNSDYVVLAHTNHTFLLSVFCPNVISPISPPVYTWNSKDIITNNCYILNLDRKFEVGGKFYYYKNFSYRNQIVKKLQNQNINWDIGFVYFDDNSYHIKTKIEKLMEWTSYKSSLIVSTSDDIPIRFFDALLTGSIPIVHKILKQKILSLNRFPDDSVIWYDESDLDSFENIVLKANSYFDNGGIKAIQNRQKWVLENYTQDVVINKILEEIGNK